MHILKIFVIFCAINMVSGSGIANLVSFYTKLRKLCLCRCGTPQNEGAIHDMPWLATIYEGKTIVRGTLISDRHVVTAATPFIGKSAKDLKVTLGALEMCKGDHALNSSVEAVLIHPGYFSSGKYNDLALLRLRNHVTFSKFISPICMPVVDSGETYQLTWTSVWARTNTVYCLSQITALPALPSRVCSKYSKYPSEISLSDKNCLGPEGVKSIVCEEDIGSPVMTRWTTNSPFRIMGVVTLASCKDDISPLFTRIVDNLIWIQDNISEDCQCF